MTRTQAKEVTESLDGIENDLDSIRSAWDSFLMYVEGEGPEPTQEVKSRMQKYVHSICGLASDALSAIDTVLELDGGGDTS